MVRLQKFLADAGVASRRSGEQAILEGRVAVNGEIIRAMGTKVDPERDRVTVDGRPVKAKRRIYVALNKPRGLVCSRKDELERPTIYTLLPREWGHLHTVGRLDFASQGLIFLTNDGQFSLRLTHPRYGVRKIYRVTIEGRVEPSVLESFTRGIWQEGEKLSADKAQIRSSSNAQTLLELQLSHGKNREVRRMCEALSLTIKRLQRVQIGNIKLGELPEGKWRTLTEPEIKSLLC